MKDAHIRLLDLLDAWSRHPGNGQDGALASELYQQAGNLKNKREISQFVKTALLLAVLKGHHK